jgi:hypothetical protein
MKHNGLDKLYDRLTPEERFRLDVEAIARGDSEESRRLVDTCPRRSYTMTELGFSGRWDGAIQLCMAALLDFRYTTAKLRMIDAFRTVIPYSQTLAQDAAFNAYVDGHRSGSYHAWNAAGKTGRPPAWPELDLEPDDVEWDPAMERDMEEIEAKVVKYGELLPELMDRLERELATGALAVWDAFSIFCEGEMGLSAEKLLQATFEPALEDVAWFGDLCERLELEADRATVEECREALGAHWQRIVERGSV